MYVQLTIRDTRIDVQRDIHLDRGDIDFSAGPDKRLAQPPFRQPWWVGRQ